MPYYGLNGLDQRLEKYLDFDCGIFFEAGANDGITQSNTRYFEESRGWRGILVEPIPNTFLACSLNRPNAYCHWGALSSGDSQYVDLTYCGLMTTTDGAFLSPEDVLRHIESGVQFLGGNRPHRFTAPSFTIEHVCTKYRFLGSQIDLMVIDIEGYEIKALKGLGSVRPRFILVETRYPDQVSQILCPLGYSRIDQMSVHDYLYLYKGD